MNRRSTPLIIDVEASGFGGHSYPIEVGVALQNGQRFCSLIIPIASWEHWDEDAEKVHGISRQILCDHGKSVNEVANLLNNKLAGTTLYSDGWVVDKPWLTTLFHAAQQPMKFTVSPLELILSEHQMNVWHHTKNEVISEQEDIRHRASYDAWVIQETYRRTWEE